MLQVVRGIRRASLGRRLRPLEGALTRPVTMASENPVETSIRQKLRERFQPVHLDVVNESYMHNVPRGSETHFKVVVVSDSFDSQALIKRHRLVNDVLKDELEGPVHALSIQAKTPSQWSKNSSVSKSPACLGGMAREKANSDGGAR